MKSNLLRKEQNFTYIIPLLLFAIAFFITKSAVFLQYPKQLSVAVTLDLVLIIPFIYYVIIRKTSISKYVSIFIVVIY